MNMTAKRLGKYQVPTKHVVHPDVHNVFATNGWGRGVSEKCMTGMRNSINTCDSDW
jgi:hypothetical protein